MLGEVSGAARRPPAKATTPNGGGIQIPAIRLDNPNGSRWDLVLDLLSYLGIAVSGVIFIDYAARYVRQHTRSP